MTMMEAYFTELAKTWDSQQPESGSLQEMVARLAGVSVGSRVLDLGCGTGIMEPAYLSLGAREVVALDVAPGMIDRAKDKFVHEPRVRFLCQDVLTYEEEEPFDVAVIYNAYPHFLDRYALVAKVASLLVPGGRFLVAHGMGRTRLNEHHCSVPAEVTSELCDAQSESAVWKHYFHIDVESDTPQFYCFGGAQKEGRLEEGFEGLDLPLASPERILSMPTQYAAAQLLFIATRVDAFSCLAEGVTVEAFAETTGFDHRNSRLFLNALVAADYVTKCGEVYRNADDVQAYLTRQGPRYLGDHLLFWSEIKDISRAEPLLKAGIDPSYSADELGSDSYDFEEMARVSVNPLYLGRVQDIVAVVSKLVTEVADESDGRSEGGPRSSSFQVLDLGGGSGVFAAELAYRFPGVHATVFDQDSVIPVAKDQVLRLGVQRQVTMRTGDFVVDDIGSGYDLIIAAGILDFCGDIAPMASKLSHALKPGGWLYVDTHRVNDDRTAPTSCILGWLVSHMSGLDILKTDREIFAGLAKAGFVQVDEPGSGLENCRLLRKDH